MERFFTQDERYLMMDHNVPELVARQRIRLGWDRERAMTEPLQMQRKFKSEQNKPVLSTMDLNWKE